MKKAKRCSSTIAPFRFEVTASFAIFFANEIKKNFKKPLAQINYEQFVHGGEAGLRTTCDTNMNTEAKHKFLVFILFWCTNMKTKKKTVQKNQQKTKNTKN